MNYTKHIAARAYDVYMQNGKGQLSPDDALWITDQYLSDHPGVMIEDAIHEVIKQLMESDY